MDQTSQYNLLILPIIFFKGCFEGFRLKKFANLKSLLSNHLKRKKTLPMRICYHCHGPDFYLRYLMYSGL